jgi:transcription elongation factor GreA
LQKKFPFLKINPPFSFKEFLDQIEDPIMIYENINTTDYKKDFLLYLKKYHKNWDDLYIRIFYLYPNRFIFDELMNKDPNTIEKIVKELISGYKEYKEAFFWIISNILTEEKIKEMNIDHDNIILSLIHLVELTGKEISLKKDVTKNKKISNQAKDYLFKNNFLPEYIKKSDIEFCKRLYTISNELLSLDGESVVIIKDTIVEKYPDIDTEDNILRFDAGMGKTSIIDKLLTVEESFVKMQRELIHIKDVDVPENSKEIGWAMEKGDLKENAEFKAAKERQTFLQNKLNKLMNDLGRAIIVKKDEITGKFITFGTKVLLTDKINNSKVTYIILGPWESDTEKNIISYQSPLGANLLDKKLNDEIKFVLNDKTYDYIVDQIEVYTF